VVATRRLELVAEYEEMASAAKARLVFDRMMRGAHRGTVDVLAVWALDRFGQSMVGNLQTVLELDRCGVQIVRRISHSKLSANFTAETARRI
jgi:DNA invertase Pin-like site-specific DNA recombinase